MGMGPPPPWPPQPPHHHQGLCFGAPCRPWGAGHAWWCADADGMESMERGGGSGGPGLRFLLHLDTGEPAVLDRSTLLGFSLSALLTRLLGWSKDGRQGRASSSLAIAGAAGGEEESGSAAAVSAAALAAAVSLTLAAMYASDQRPPPPPPRARRPPPLPPAPDSVPAARARALPAPQEGLRILSSNDEPSDSVIHGASIGCAGDDEPDIVARVEMEMEDTTPAAIATTARDETEAEGEERLRELWLSLVEREQRLELRLQELEGLRAQEAAVRELESRAAAAAMEERMLQLRLSTLQEENGRLRAQADDLGAARADLARAKDKLRALKARLQADQDEAAALRAAVAELERARDERDQSLAAEIADLRNANAKLEEDNLELALRLQDAQQAAAATSANLDLQEDLAEEAKYLRESNERLTRQIEQLRNDHCAHVEELVYLKWVNACLRHELLRDHDGGHPTTTGGQQDHHGGAANLTALELSKSMSFRSSERAKQLMLRYGHPGLDGFDNPAAAVISPLHESSVDGDGDERSPARTSASGAAAAALAGKKTGPRKLKFLGNIKKLLPGGKRSHSSHGHAGRGGGKAPAPAPVPSDEYLEKAMRWLSTHDVLDSDHSYESTPLSSCARTPLSSVTTNTTADSRGAPRGGGGHSERVPRAEPVFARSKSDAGGSYGREASPYHALRPDHPAASRVEPQGLRATAMEMREARRRSAGAQLSDA